MTIAATAAAAHRDQILGPEQAKRTAAVRSYCNKIEVMTRPELKKEIEKYKRRRAHVSININDVTYPHRNLKNNGDNSEWIEECL